MSTYGEMVEKSSESPSFSSLPYDIALNCLARIARIHHPTLSLVSKTFRSILTSPEFFATRSLNGYTKSFLYVCINHYYYPSWYILSPIPKQNKLESLPEFPYYEHPKDSTIVSIGLSIYIIGGYINRKLSSRVFRLDGRSHKWSEVPGMRVPRARAAAQVIDGKIYVIDSYCSEGEIYNPKTQIWEPLSPTTRHLIIQKRVVFGGLVEMGGKFYAVDGLKLRLMPHIYLVEIENVLCQVRLVHYRYLEWHDPNEDLKWRFVKGLEGLFVPSLAISSDGGRGVTIWWKTFSKIWRAKVSFERRRRQELWGFVEWSEDVTISRGCCDRFLGHSATVTD